MRFRICALATAVALSLGGMAGAQQYDVHVMATPNARITNFHSFRLLPAPRRLDGARKSGAYDPMVSNSIANRTLRWTVSGELEVLGYHDAEWMPDFVVAIYATTHQRLDLDVWDYGYHHSPQWWSMTTPDQTSTSYQEGTVIVDVVSPATLDVLWRGSATIAVDHDPLVNAKEIANAAAAIIDRFPRAKSIVVAATR